MFHQKMNIVVGYYYKVTFQKIQGLQMQELKISKRVAQKCFKAGLWSRRVFLLGTEPGDQASQFSGTDPYKKIKVRTGQA